MAEKCMMYVLSLFSCQKNVNKAMGLKSLLLHITKLLKLIEFYNILKKH